MKPLQGTSANLCAFKHTIKPTNTLYDFTSVLAVCIELQYAFFYYSRLVIEGKAQISSQNMSLFN